MHANAWKIENTKHMLLVSNMMREAQEEEEDDELKLSLLP